MIFNYLDLGIFLSFMGAFLFMEIYWNMKAKNSLNPTAYSDKRFNVYFIILIPSIITFILIDYYYHLTHLICSEILLLVVFLYLILSDKFLFGRKYHYHFNFKQNPEILAELIISGILLLVLIISTLYQTFNQASLIQGAVFGGNNDWFSETFTQMLSSDNVGAILTLMIIGGLTIIIAKGRRSRSMAVSGFFLIIGLPLFDVIDSLFRTDAESRIVDTAIYTTFQNVGLSIFIYTIIQMMFYMLVISIVVSFISLISDINVDD